MTIIRVKHPDSYLQERTYIYDVVLGDFLGLEYVLERDDTQVTSISLIGDQQERALHVEDTLFRLPFDRWMTVGSLPGEHVEVFATPDRLMQLYPLKTSIPVMYGRCLEGGSYYSEEPDGEARLTVDVFGSAFFMLARLEELIVTSRDQHGRFPAHLSTASRAGFLDRPIVNECVDLLWSAILRQWPRLRRRRRTYRVELSHDVDHPWGACMDSWADAVRGCAGDVLKRRDLALALRRISSRAVPGKVGFTLDPYNTFDFLMSTDEAAGLRGSFYFMACSKRNIFDGDYQIRHPEIRRLMRAIHARGHNIGFHGSYDTIDQLDMAIEQIGRLRDVALEEGVDLHRFGGRQHYLRWRCPDTWRIWEAIGADYDSSVGFADIAGFRAGTCYEYKAFDAVSRKPLELVERPLIVMDGTLTSAQYMNLSKSAACEYVSRLANECRQHGGVMTLLWHNSSLLSLVDREFYRTVVDCIV